MQDTLKDFKCQIESMDAVELEKLAIHVKLVTKLHRLVEDLSAKECELLVTIANKKIKTLKEEALHHLSYTDPLDSESSDISCMLL